VVFASDYQGFCNPLPRPLIRHSREGGNPALPLLWRFRIGMSLLACSGNLSLLPRRTGFPPSREWR